MDWRSEFFGGSVALDLPGNVGIMRPPGRIPGSSRFYRADPSALSVAFLPRANLMPNGESVVLYNANGANSIVLLDQNSVPVSTTPPNHVSICYQTSGATAAGTWVVIDYPAVEGGSHPMGRVLLDCTITTDTDDFNLRDYHVARGWDGVTPAALRVWVGSPDRHYLMGNSGNTDSARDTGFETGAWPSGSSLLLFNYGTISGRGGVGGRGGDVPPGLLSQVGGVGTNGMRVRVNTVLCNYGTIQGGGGGGGGSGWNGSTSAGSGGGGGQGHPGGRGGAPGTGTGGVAGTDGSVFVRGAGGSGVSQGGQGGSPGGVGDTGSIGSLGGAGGYSILRHSAYTLTKLVAGTILGAEDTF